MFHTTDIPIAIVAFHTHSPDRARIALYTISITKVYLTSHLASAKVREPNPTTYVGERLCIGGQNAVIISFSI